MTKLNIFCSILMILSMVMIVSAQEKGIVKPELLLRQTVEGMPKGDKQEVRVLSAKFEPNDKTLFHTHRYPVTLYVLEGAFTLKMEGRDPVTVKMGEAMMMPPNVRMTGYNTSGTESLRLVIFYVSDPDTPFLDPIH